MYFYELFVPACIGIYGLLVSAQADRTTKGLLYIHVIEHLAPEGLG